MGCFVGRILALFASVYKEVPGKSVFCCEDVFKATYLCGVFLFFEENRGRQADNLIAHDALIKTSVG